MALRDYLVGEVAEDFVDGLLTRREALRRLGLLGLGASSAGLLLAACAGTAPSGTAPSAAPPAPNAAAPSAAPPGGEPPGRGPGVSRGSEIRFAGPAGELRGAWAAPAAGQAKGALLVVHENRGLTAHFYDLVGRFAGAGYGALCVDLLSAQGGTAALTDPAQVPTALANAPATDLLADLRAGMDELGKRVPGTKLGGVGFCFGGGMIWQLLNAGDTRLAAAVPFYGPAPENPNFTRAKAAVLAVYGALDARVDATIPRAEAALRAAGLPYQVRVFDGADHAFFNDTGQRYQPDAARTAWSETLDWFGKYLAAG